MRIVICDDVQKELEIIWAVLDTCAEAHSELHFDIDGYGAAVDVLNAVKNGKVYDIALLDICMPGGPGTRISFGKPLRLHMKLSQMFEEIQKYTEFIKAGVSYVVNLDHVRSTSGNSMEMKDGVKIPVPCRSVEEVQRVYMKFCRKEAGK